MDKYNPVIPSFGHMIHGADYNPEQWIETPEVWDEDMRLMKLAGMNSASVGIFSWSMLEPEEGKYDFSFLDTIMDKLAKNGMKAVLATPSGARPAWLSKKYPEVLRVTPERVRRLHGERHNHCMSSPIYREKVSELNKRLAERYKNHPALGLWHISNEISGECHCELCQENFRSWLRKKYNNDIDRLNHEWPSAWALEDCQGFQRHEKKYHETLNAHYAPSWKNGINTDIIGAEADFAKYKLIIAPMLYMTDEGLIKRLAEYVEKGGTLVFTYISGLVNENDLCWLWGCPGGKLKEIFGLWAEETDTLYPDQYNTVRLSDGREYKAVDYCEVVHSQGAEVLAEYTDDFYKGCPALLKNSYGKGSAYYIAFRDTGDFCNDFYCELADSLKIERSFDGELPPLVSAHSREDGEHKYVFVENYSDKQVKLKTGTVYENILTGEQESGTVDVDGFGVKIFKLRK